MDKMVDRAPDKFVLVHLGPHKTGSTAIQKSLSAASELLQTAGIYCLSTSETHKAALDLANEQFDDAEGQIAHISELISSLSQSNVILSQEDFCGPLVGRSTKRNVYPRLTKNLRVLTRALRPHTVKFAFFVRDETEWLRSCYHQHLKFRTRFHRFEDFAKHFGNDLSWAAKLKKPQEVFGSSFVQLNYCSDPASGINALLSLVPSKEVRGIEVPGFPSVNKSPTAEQIEQLERINELTEFGPSSWYAKSLILRGKKALPVPADATNFPEWPPVDRDPQDCALPMLLRRSKTRVQQQEVEDVLPLVTVDLDQLANESLPTDVQLPSLQRKDIRNQVNILNYHIRGKSKLNHLNALTISYLRRDTAHTEKARRLFHRIWCEKGILLVNELSTRWLISTLQTFVDHGENEAQRSIGTAGYFYGNMMKIYEGERAIEGLDQDAGYAGHEPQTKNQFRGMDRYSVGGSDLMLNTNALALEFAQRDEIAGLVLQEFLLRVKSAENVFSRHDRTRKDKNINVSGFQDVWAFFEPWKD